MISAIVGTLIQIGSKALTRELYARTAHQRLQAGIERDVLTFMRSTQPSVMKSYSKTHTEAEIEKALDGLVNEGRLRQRGFKQHAKYESNNLFKQIWFDYIDNNTLNN